MTSNLRESKSVNFYLKLTSVLYQGSSLVMKTAHQQQPISVMRPVIFRLIKVSFKFVSSTRFFSSSSAFLRRHSHEKSSEYLSFSLHPRERQDSPAVRLQANQKRSVLRRLAPQSHLPGCSEVSERHLQMMSSYRK